MTVHTESNDGRCFTYAVAWVTFLASNQIIDIECIAVVVARTRGYFGSWYCQTRSCVYCFSNLASGFQAYFCRKRLV